jgi:hypothetical protein
MRRVCVVAIVAVAAALACAQEITSDYDRNIRLADLRSFQLATQERHPEEALAANPLVDRRIAAALRSALVANGIAESQEPKFLVAYYASVKERTEVRAYGWGRPYFGGATATFDTQHYSEGTLVVDFIEADSKTLVWRGTMTDTVDPNRSGDKLEKKIAKLIRKFQKDVEKQQKAAPAAK